MKKHRPEVCAVVVSVMDPLEDHGPGGRLVAIVPDGQAMLEGWSAGTYTFDDFREVLFGAQDYVGDYHFNLLTPDSLKELLVSQGFTNVRVVERGRRNGQCFEFEIEACRP